MVTGSHIPFDRNGLKFYRPGGEEISKGDEAGILAALAAPGPARAGGGPGRFGRGRALRGALGGASSARGASRGFASASTSTAPPGAMRCGARSQRSGRRWSRSGGATASCRSTPRRSRPRQAERIRGWVAEHRLAALVSTDGDGDRPLVADETGRVLRGDALGALAAQLSGRTRWRRRLNASTALEGSGWFARVLRTRIGSPHVIEGMARLKAEGARLAGGLRGERRVPARGDGRVARKAGGWSRCRPATRWCRRWRSSPPWRARGGRSRRSWPTCPRARRTAAGWQEVDVAACGAAPRGAGGRCARPATRCSRGSGGRSRGDGYPRRGADDARVGRDRAPAPLGQCARAALLRRGRDAERAGAARQRARATWSSSCAAGPEPSPGEARRVSRAGAPASGSRKGSRSAGAGRSAAFAASLRRKRTSSAELGFSPPVGGPRVCSIGIHASMNTREGPVGR